MHHVLAIIESHSQAKAFAHQGYLVSYYVFKKTSNPIAEANLAIKSLKDEKIHGVFGVSDRTSALASLIAQELDLPGPKPKAVASIQHKSIALELLSEIDSKYTFQVVSNVIKDKCKDFSFPVFYKPIKSNLSQGVGFAHSREELNAAIQKNITSPQKNLNWYSKFFSHSIYNVKNSSGLIVQNVFSGDQFTADGFVFQGNVVITAVTRSILDARFQSFLQFDFPTYVPEAIIKKVRQISDAFFKATQFDNLAFNIEFFVSDTDITVIEFNTRVSFQFLKQFDLASNRMYSLNILRIACGKKMRELKITPKLLTSCYIFRSDTDLYTLEIPKKEELASFLLSHPDILEIKVFAKNNHFLSEASQDPFSFRYASLTLKGTNQKSMNSNYFAYKLAIDSLFKFKT